ncbi:MAG: sulfatase-like hydrolase/transferase [Verrucomicrobiota bacterium]
MAPSSAAAGQPDIVILLTDQQRAKAMGVVDPAGFHTPAMDQLAREGTRFTHAFCATPQCSPARAAFWTGRFPHRTGVMGNIGGEPVPAGMSSPLNPKIPSLGQVFSAAGYETAYFGKWHLGKTPGQYGFQTHAAERADAEATRQAVAFLKKRSAPPGNQRPLLMVVSWVNPHDIYAINRGRDFDATALKSARLPENLHDDLRQKPFPQRLFLEADQGKAVRGYRQEDWQRYVAFYRRLTEEVDAAIGQVVQEVRRTLPEAVLVFSSDHGDLGGAHGLPFKGPAMYDELVRVPFIISQPGKFKPSVCDALVSQIDLLPTLCDLAHLSHPPGIDGRSLVPLLTGATESWTGRNAIFAEYYGKQDWRVPIRMVRTRDWKYVRYLGYGEELYHLESDPRELKNLAGVAERKQKQQDLAGRLDTWLAQTQDPFAQLTVTDRQGRPLPLPRETGVQTAASNRPPNIVLIIADDQAWTDFGFMGHPVIRTPHLDKLAAESALFPHGYVPTALCRASLATMLTGLYAGQHKICCNDPPEGVARETMHRFIQEAPTVPRLLRQLGYRSLQTGKFWEGHYSNGGFTHGMTEKGRHGDAGLVIGRQTLQPIYEFIEAGGEQPFFVWYAPMMPHEPHTPPERILQKYLVEGRNEKLARYWAMCEWFDETCGELLGWLDKKGLRQNTLVAFVVDNGWIQETGPSQTTRGWFAPKSKLSPYDGGVRTPILLRWPGRTKPGRLDDLVSSIDLAPTFLSACGLKPDERMTGWNLLDCAAGKMKLDRHAVFGETFLHTSVDLEKPERNLTHRWMRQGDWKLIVPVQPQAGPELYNLAGDPQEKTNLAARETQRMEQLLKTLNAWPGSR